MTIWKKIYNVSSVLLAGKEWLPLDSNHRKQLNRLSSAHQSIIRTGQVGDKLSVKVGASVEEVTVLTVDRYRQSLTVRNQEPSSQREIHVADVVIQGKQSVTLTFLVRQRRACWLAMGVQGKKKSLLIKHFLKIVKQLEKLKMQPMSVAVVVKDARPVHQIKR